MTDFLRLPYEVQDQIYGMSPPDARWGMILSGFTYCKEPHECAVAHANTRHNFTFCETDKLWVQRALALKYDELSAINTLFGTIGTQFEATRFVLNIRTRLPHHARISPSPPRSTGPDLQRVTPGCPSRLRQWRPTHPRTSLVVKSCFVTLSSSLSVDKQPSSSSLSVDKQPSSSSLDINTLLALFARSECNFEATRIVLNILRVTAVNELACVYFSPAHLLIAAEAMETNTPEKIARCQRLRRDADAYLLNWNHEWCLHVHRSNWIVRKWLQYTDEAGETQQLNVTTLAEYAEHWRRQAGWEIRRAL
ncbi:hypothetical protein FN846DRAFT_913312 [Sphaerosporella brunnea]|uniref:Uncharacterized protein n=1 Tax=Sphaerosporella brunnea TaxID=1250544 RepID=A0A5J5EFQ3_9PEZI|nr:hypothetical protein FN846DRAFT_913312 [Sphaerosporella brunnea]